MLFTVTIYAMAWIARAESQITSNGKAVHCVDGNGVTFDNYKNGTSMCTCSDGSPCSEDSGRKLALIAGRKLQATSNGKAVHCADGNGVTFDNYKNGTSMCTCSDGSP